MIRAVTALGSVPFYERSPPPFLDALSHLLIAFDKYFPSDRFQFGHAWYLLRPHMQTGRLEELILERRRTIQRHKERWRRTIKERRAHERLAQGSSMTPLEEGLGCAYVMAYEGTPELIVKPVDEEIFCLNNRKGYGTPLDSLRVRGEIPLYRSAQTDCMAFELCALSRLPPITPKTWMEILESPSFYDLHERIPSEERSPLMKEKLCSVQEYLLPKEPHLMTLIDWLQEKGVELLDPADVEAVCLFSWLIHDTDGHARNILVYPKSPTLYGLFKIDNTLSFPEENVRLENCLLEFPVLAARPLSAKSKTVLHDLPIDEILARMRHYEMESAIPAFLERVTLLRSLAARDGITLSEIEHAFKGHEQ